MHYDSNVPIYLQVMDSLKKKIISGEMLPGDKLPSTRILAVEYDINPNTAARVYKELEMQGICFTKRGEGTFVIESAGLIDQLSEETATLIIRRFINEMSDLGFNKTQIINKINEMEI